MFSSSSFLKQYFCTPTRLALNTEAHRRRRKWTEREEITYARKRQALTTQIEKHRHGAQRYLPPQVVDHIPDPESYGLDDAWVDDDDCDDEKDGSCTIDLAQLTISVSHGMPPETGAICLPSTIGYEACTKLGLQNVMKNELALRQGEANDALQAIRIQIGEKSFRFRKQLRNSKSKVQKTRSWDAIHTVDRRLQQNCSIYRQARHAMVRLGAPQAIQDRYQEITPDDLHTNTAVQEPNARGQRNKELSWIWRMPGVICTNQESLLHECGVSADWLIPGLNDFSSL
jgi:hypothetical protein